MIRNCYISAVTLLADGSLCSWRESAGIKPFKHDIGPCIGFNTAQDPPVIVVATGDGKFLLTSPGEKAKHQDITEAVMTGSEVKPYGGVYGTLRLGPEDIIENYATPIDQNESSKRKALEIIDGCIYVCESPDDTEPPIKIEFDREEYVIDIVSQRALLGIVFILTRSGACYYIDALAHTRKPVPNPADIIQKLCANFGSEGTAIVQSGLASLLPAQAPPEPPAKYKTVRLEFLSDYIVDDVFVLTYCIIIRHDGGKLSLLRPYDMDMGILSQMFGDGWKIRTGYLDGTEKPEALSCLDGIDIVDIQGPTGFIYFIEASGQVYIWEIDDPANICIKKIPFFDENPIAIPNKASKIRSTASMLK